MRKFVSILVIVCFFITSAIGNYSACAQALPLPVPGAMVELTPAFEPALIKGLTIDKNNPFRFNFIMDAGKSGLSGEALKKEGERLVKYFFACLTIPQKDLWVNLSPYEKDRIIPQALGKTPLGRDLLEQDYILKQLTASLIYPEKRLGKEFWSRVYAKARELYGTSQVPVNTFNKVWIIADKATVYERGQTAFVLDSHLKVMLEEDYLSLQKHSSSHSIASQVVRTIILPEIEKEVNQGQNFAPLRQIYNSLILASWYKKSLKQALLSQFYVDKSTVNGVNLADPSVKERIYQQYLQAYKKGVFNFIKDETDSNTKETLPRKYFSGGFSVSSAMLTVKNGPGFLQQIASQLGKSKVLFSLAVALSLNAAAIPSTAHPASIAPRTVLVNDAAMFSPLGETLGLIAPQQLLEGSHKHDHQGTPMIFSTSDQHGAIKEFDEFIVYALREGGVNLPPDFKLDPYRTLAQQLREQGIDIADLKGKVFFHNLGDWMDRGPRGVAVALRSIELCVAGLSDYVVGNHDLYAWGAILGIHLPYYDGFDTHGYTDDYDGVYGKVDALLKKDFEDNRKQRDSKKREMWAERLAQQRSFYDKLQKDKWGKEEEGSYLSRGKKLYSQITAGLNSKDAVKTWEFEEEGILWGKLIGRIPGVGDVDTGVKAVGLVSIKWWQDRLEEFKKVRDRINGLDPEKKKIYQDAIDLIEDIIKELKGILEQHLNQGEWWWRVFEATNAQNYSSLEWATQDWPYHKGWGTSVFKELFENNKVLNNYIHELIKNYPSFHKYVKGMLDTNLDTEWDASNFHENVVLGIIAEFIQNNFNLHIHDVMQIDYMHAPLPVNEHGEYNINYDEINYRGKEEPGHGSFVEGLRLIARDVHEATSIAELIKPLSAVNKLYVESETQAKPDYIAQALLRFGIAGLLEVNGISVGVVFGHNPVSDFKTKLPEDMQAVTGPLMISPLSKRFYISGDGGVSPKYLGGGLMFEFGIRGVQGIGRNAPGELEPIRLNPQVHYPIGGVSTPMFDKIVPIPSEEFFNLVIKSIALNLIKERLNPEQYVLIKKEHIDKVIRQEGKFRITVDKDGIIIRPDGAMNAPDDQIKKPEASMIALQNMDMDELVVTLRGALVKKPMILYVEDDPTITKQSLLRLKKMGWEVSEGAEKRLLVADNRKTAEDLLQMYSNQIGLVLTDNNMPEVHDGFVDEDKDVGLNFARQAASMDLPVILISSVTVDLQEIDQGIRFIRKFDFNDLFGRFFDKAQSSPVSPGGIDLNASAMATTIRREGAGVEMKVDAALFARIRKEGIQSLTPYIDKVTPIRSIWSVFDMQAQPRYN